MVERGATSAAFVTLYIVDETAEKLVFQRSADTLLADFFPDCGVVIRVQPFAARVVREAGEPLQVEDAVEEEDEKKEEGHVY